MKTLRKITQAVHLLAGGLASLVALLFPAACLLIAWRPTPESGLDPTLWPLVGKTGVAAIAGALAEYGLFALIRASPLRALAQARESMSRERELTRKALQCIDHGVIVADRDGAVEMVNHAAEKLTGWTEPEARGCPLREMFHTVHGATRTSQPSLAKRVMKPGEAAALAEDSVLMSRCGVERAIGARTAPVREVCSVAEILGESAGLALTGSRSRWIRGTTSGSPCARAAAGARRRTSPRSSPRTSRRRIGERAGAFDVLLHHQGPQGAYRRRIRRGSRIDVPRLPAGDRTCLADLADGRNPVRTGRRAGPDHG